MAISFIGLPLVLYGKAIPHVWTMEAVLIPVLEPVLNPVWVLVFVGEVPSGWALLGGVTVLESTGLWLDPQHERLIPRPPKRKSGGGRKR